MRLGNLQGNPGCSSCHRPVWSCTSASHTLPCLPPPASEHVRKLHYNACKAEVGSTLAQVQEGRKVARNALALAITDVLNSCMVPLQHSRGSHHSQALHEPEGPLNR